MTKQIEIIFENDNFLVVDKPAGVLVHPTPQPSSGQAAANKPDTLVSWLIARYPGIENLSWPDKTRAGIVHRLDKDTSGLILLAKNPQTLEKLQELFKSRTVKKTYQALVVGKAPEEGKVEAGIVRDSDKDMMKIQETTYSFTKGTVRAALTEYKILKHYRYQDEDLSLVEVYPQTGRMHQIRLHMKYAGYPLIGDQMYNTKLSSQLSKNLGLERQFLHAVELRFNDYDFKSELASDLKNVLGKLS